MTINNKKIITVLKYLGIAFGVVLISLFAFRNLLLNKVISKIDQKLYSSYQCHFSVKSAEFKGFNSIEFSQIALVPKQGDTLVAINQLQTSIAFGQLLLGAIQLGELKINRGYIQFVKNKNGSNFEEFLKSKKEDNKSDEGIDYAKLTNRIFSKLFDLVPTDMQVNGFEIKIDDMGKKVAFDFKKLQLKSKQLVSEIKVADEISIQNWSISGFADPRDRKADIVFASSDTTAISIPYIKQKWNLDFGFKKIRFNLNQFDKSGDDLYINGNVAIEKLNVQHQKIASKNVMLNEAQLNYNLVFGPRFVALDSTSSIVFNAVKLRPFVKYSNEKDKIIEAKIEISKMKAQDFITSLPSGLFSHIEGMQAQGDFSYKLNFKFNKNKPQDLVFESKLKPENLKITHYGAADLNKINTEFTYRAIERGVLQRPVFIGASNPNFTPLSNISPYLQKCVLTSEDPSFFQHRGFINEAFKQSIAKNIRTQKFSRGASTISMQLIKNMFLTREKTLSRKLEEILLVYILENNRISSKERMLEVYFNIIEWGPNVYGVGEAAAFYFQKKPADLNLNECLFLATIIPRPKGFMFRIDNDGSSKKFAQQQYSFLTKLMLRRNLITADDTIGQHKSFLLTGAAVKLLKQKSFEIEADSIPANQEEY